MENTNIHRTAVINGDLKFTNVGQILKSRTFGKMLNNFVEELESRHSKRLKAIKPFRNEAKQFDTEKFRDFLILLNMKPLKEVMVSGYFDIQYGVDEYATAMLEFLEGLYNYWRNFQRFMVKNEPYIADDESKRSKAHSLSSNNESLKKLVLELYRNIMYNVTGESFNIYRQLPSGAQVAFLVDRFEFSNSVKSKNDSLYRVPYVWEAIFEPPVIFYTQSNKRNGVFPIKKDKKILERFYMDCDSWFAIPVKAGRLLIMVYCHKNFLELGAGLFNLFQLATPEEFLGKKPDGVVFFGLDKSLFDEDEKLGFIVKEDGVYYGMLPNDPAVDYFGYMKKMILTLHNIIQIKNFWLPIHGAFARIHIGGAKPVNIMLVGDSGAGKSETLEAIHKLPKEMECEVDILIDDMGSLHFNREDELMAVGTEIGAFVRLDDLQPGYAYSTMDRSIFMNPNLINARVIVPQMAYEDIAASTPVDYIFYINNYEKIEGDLKPIEFFDNLDQALEVFSEGRRMAKGTTGEVGMTATYFANPFGAVQLRPEHERIAENYFQRMKEKGIEIGMIRTQLGIPGREQDGPLAAATALVDFVKNLK
ncbi:MAG: hypothetical protein Q4C55_06725 [Eubacterium sp.]|nr:hypothetical protein [Eubacterium sp.]